MFLFLLLCPPSWYALLFFLGLSSKLGCNHTISSCVVWIIDPERQLRTCICIIILCNLRNKQIHYALDGRVKFIYLLFVVIDSCCHSSIYSNFISVVCQSLLHMKNKLRAPKMVLQICLFLFWSGKVLLNGNKYI